MNSSFPPKLAFWDSSAPAARLSCPSAPCPEMSPSHILLHVTSPRATCLWPACPALLGRVGTALDWLPGGVWFALYRQRHLGKRTHPLCSQRGCLCWHCSSCPSHLIFPCLLAQGKSQASLRHQKRAEFVWGGGNGRRAQEEHRQQQSRCSFLGLFSPT